MQEVRVESLEKLETQKGADTALGKCELATHSLLAVRTIATGR
jgi:hypothetical protein